jgi:CRISPR-associated endonuclease/helicase Cas3
MAYYARPAPEGGGTPQLLRDHLNAVANRAATFAAEIGLDPDQARWTGLLHDLGKYSDEFQQHRLCLTEDGTPNGADSWRVEHAAHGAWVADYHENRDRSIAFAVAGHHSGLQRLLDVQSLSEADRFERGSLTPRKLAIGHRAVEFFQRAYTDKAFVGEPRAVRFPGDEDAPGRLDFDLRTRMLFSCLVDADRLDAEGHGNAWKSYLRDGGQPLDPERRLESVLSHISGKAASSTGAVHLNEVRRRVLESSLASAAGEPGFFSMTVPTGGGKTLASLAFALAHAAKHDLRRIIFVIPYLSIIEQNVDVIRAAVGDERLVLEHHSNVVDEVDEDEAKGTDGQQGEGLRRRLLAENWDAPIVVTTTVQFFDSLFSNRPKRARKLHNIARSVVVFDEAQTFPPEMMEPMMEMLQQLAGEPYRTTFLFCTATQPAISIPLARTKGPARPLVKAPVQELVPDSRALYASLKRVEYDWPDGETRSSPEEVADGMHALGQALAIVNTKEQARVLFRALRARNPEAIHLSTRMCADHRLGVLAGIRARLVANQPCLVAATQLVEAGVDVDFPAVWRAIGPLDSIAQAAGRCNREGRMAPALGRVTVFNTWDKKLPPGSYETGTNVTRRLLALGKLDLHDPNSFERYFRNLYNASDLDKGSVQPLRISLDFPGVAAAFKIIDSETTPVLVGWEESKESKALIAELRALGPADLPSADFLRRIHRYTVGLYPKELGRATTVEIAGVRVFLGEYDRELGLVLPGDYSED